MEYTATIYFAWFPEFWRPDCEAYYLKPGRVHINYYICSMKKLSR